MKLFGNKSEQVFAGALNSVNSPENMKKDLDDFTNKISTTDNLEALIAESSNMSSKEEELARAFVARGTDREHFLKTARFETTKEILSGKLEKLD